MIPLLSRRWSRRPPAALRRRTNRPIGQVDALEPRWLLFYAVNVTASPAILFPPNGRLVPVEVSGTFVELNHAVPKHPEGAFQVVDEYREIGPSGPLALTHQSGNTFSFQFTLDLKASRSLHFAAGRRYYISVAALDDDGWSGRTIPVWVPRDRQQLFIAEHKPRFTPKLRPLPKPRAIAGRVAGPAPKAPSASKPTTGLSQLFSSLFGKV